MPVRPLPGLAAAQAAGYTVHAHSADRSWVDYTQGRLCLRVCDKGQATLSAQVGLVKLEIGPFSFPHPKLSLFEAAISTLLPKECSCP